jgi:hypothetical protein
VLTATGARSERRIPTKQSADGHNVPVTRSGLPQRARTASVAVLVATALVLSACGADNSEKKPKAAPSSDLPTGNVDVPSGVTLTKAGTALTFGETATVAYQQNAKRSSVLQLTVASVAKGRIGDLAAYQLDAASKKGTPYYARVVVKNVGTGDLSRAIAPVYAVDSTNALVQAVSFNNTFTKCPSTPLPAGFTTGKTANLCLTYLLPAGRTLVEMSYRPLQQYEPITWKGAITQPPVKKTTKQPTKKNKKKDQP